MEVIKGYRQLSQFGEGKRNVARTVHIRSSRKTIVTIAPCTRCGEMTANLGKVCRTCLDRSITLMTRKTDAKQ